MAPITLELAVSQSLQPAAIREILARAQETLVALGFSQLAATATTELTVSFQQAALVAPAADAVSSLPVGVTPEAEEVQVFLAKAARMQAQAQAPVLWVKAALTAEAEEALVLSELEEPTPQVSAESEERATASVGTFKALELDTAYTAKEICS